jgi:hypothetical protein
MRLGKNVLPFFATNLEFGRQRTPAAARGNCERKITPEL